MASIPSAQSGNFSDPATWVGGYVPASTDDVTAANGHTITIDADVIAASFSQAGTGKFVVPGGRTITGDVIINEGTFSSGGTVEVTAASGETSVINGKVYVPRLSSGGRRAFTIINQAGVVVTGTGSLVINGSIEGTFGDVAEGTANECAAVYSNVNTTITINGRVSSGSGRRKHGLCLGSSASTAILIVNGNISPDFAKNADGFTYSVCMNSSSPQLTVTGDVLSNSNRNLGIFSSGEFSTITIIGRVFSSSANSPTVSTTGASSIVNVVGTIHGGGTPFGNNPSPAITTTGNSSQVNVVGDIYSSLMRNGSGIVQTGTSASTTVVGNVYGVGAPAISMQGTSSTVTITGNVEGGDGGTNTQSNFTASAVLSSGTSSLVTVIGNTIKAGLSPAIHCSATSSNFGVVATGNIINSPTGTCAIFSRFLRIGFSQNSVVKYATTYDLPYKELIPMVLETNSTGMPSSVNVRDGIVYGPSAELVGQLIVPPPNKVASGVEVDNTTGTAVFASANFTEVLAHQVAAALSSPAA